MYDSVMKLNPKENKMTKFMHFRTALCTYIENILILKIYSIYYQKADIQADIRQIPLEG